MLKSPIHVKPGGPIVYFCGRVMKGGNGYGVVGHRNQPNHVQMAGYYDRGQSKEGLEPPPVYQGVEGTIGRAVERMGGG